MKTDLVEFGESSVIPISLCDALSLGKRDCAGTPAHLSALRSTPERRSLPPRRASSKAGNTKRTRSIEAGNHEYSRVARYPWKPQEASLEDEVHARPPQPTAPSAVPAPMKQQDGDPISRHFNIKWKDLINYGHTPGCPRRCAAASGRRYKPHTLVCRRRLGRAMLDDDMGQNRMKAARARGDAFLKQSYENDVTDLRKLLDLNMNQINMCMSLFFHLCNRMNRALTPIALDP